MPRVARILAILMVMSMVVLAGCGPTTTGPTTTGPAKTDNQATPAKKADPITVRMSWGKVFQQTHWGDTGRYLDPSVKLEVLDFKTTNDQLFALQAGSLDFSVMGYNQLASALVKGDVDATIIAGLSNAPTRLILRKDVEIKDWADLKGKKIGGARGSTQYMQISIAMKKHGIDVNKDIEFVQFKGAPEMLVGIQQKAVDAVMIWEPQASQAIVDGYGKDSEVVAKTLYPDSFSSGNAIVVSNKFLKEHPNIVQKVVDAYVKSFQKVTSDKEYWMDTFNKMTGMDKKVLEVASTNARPEIHMPISEIRLIADTMYNLKFLEKNVTDQVLAKLNYTFLEKATGKPKAELGGR